MTRPAPIPETVTLHVPFRIVKRGGRKEMRLPDAATQPRKTDNTLVKALARAFRWKRMLESGEFATIAELAEREGIATSYMTRILRLFRREQFIPQRIELLDGCSSVGLGDPVAPRTRCLPCARDNLRLAEDGTQLVDDGGFNLASRHAADGTRPGAVLQNRLAEIVAVEPASLARMCRRERRAIGAEQQPLQKRGRLGAGPGRSLARAFLQDGVNLGGAALRGRGGVSPERDLLAMGQAGGDGAGLSLGSLRRGRDDEDLRQYVAR